MTSWTVRDRRATAAVAVQFAVNGAFFASFLPRLPELRDKLDISTGAIGALLTVSSASGLLASMSVKPVIARLGTRTTLLVGGVFIAIALVFVGQATTWPVALLALATMAFFDVFVDVAMNMQGSWLSARRHRPMMNRLHGLWSLGAVIGGLVAGSLAESSLSLGAHLAGAAVVLVILSTVISTQLLPTDEVHADEEAEHGQTARVFTPTRLFIAGFTAVTLETVAISWAAFRISDDLDGTAAVAAVAYVAVVGGMTIGRFAGDHASHRFGAGRLMRTSAWLAIAGTLAAGVIGLEPVAVIAFLVAGLGIATLVPRLYDLAARAGGGSAGGLGVLTAGIRSAALLAPAVIALVASGSSVGLAMALVAVVAGPAFLTTIRGTSN